MIDVAQHSCERHHLTSSLAKGGSCGEVEKKGVGVGVEAAMGRREGNEQRGGKGKRELQGEES